SAPRSAAPPFSPPCQTAPPPVPSASMCKLSRRLCTRTPETPWQAPPPHALVPLESSIVPARLAPPPACAPPPSRPISAPTPGKSPPIVSQSPSPSSSNSMSLANFQKHQRNVIGRWAVPPRCHPLDDLLLHLRQWQLEC